MATPQTDTAQSASIHTLDNGLTIAMDALPHVHSVTVGVWIHAGSSHEEASHAGISHFLEHLLFKGTDKRTAREIAQEIESRGGELNAFTSREYTCVYARVLKDHLDIAVDVLSDIVRHSQFNDLEKEKNVVLEEIASSEDVPQEHIHDVFAQRLWPDHPMGRPVAGFTATVEALSLKDIQAYHGARYKAENIIVSVAGQFDESLLLTQLGNAFGDLPGGSMPQRSGPPTPGEGAEIVSRDVAQSHLCFGFPGVAIVDERRFAAEVLSNILGGGFTSRLFEKVREDAGLAYSVYSFHQAYPLAGQFGVYAAVSPENLDQAADLCFAELRSLRDDPPSDEELATSRELLKCGLLMSLESTFNRMTRLAKSLMYHGRVRPVDEVVDQIEGVTGAHVQEIADELFQQDRCALVVLGPGDPNAPSLIHL